MAWPKLNPGGEAESGFSEGKPIMIFRVSKTKFGFKAGVLSSLTTLTPWCPVGDGETKFSWVRLG